VGATQEIGQVELFVYNFVTISILYITPPSTVSHAMFKDVQISKAQPYLETPISCILDVDHDV
jgi:hypothetical protein